MVPEGVRVVSGLHTVSARRCWPTSTTSSARTSCSAGDRKADKQQVGELLERIAGLRGVDCGRLEMARYLESLTRC